MQKNQGLRDNERGKKGAILILKSRKSIIKAKVPKINDFRDFFRSGRDSNLLPLFSLNYPLLLLYSLILLKSE